MEYAGEAPGWGAAVKPPFLNVGGGILQAELWADSSWCVVVLWAWLGAMGRADQWFIRRWLVAKEFW